MACAEKKMTSDEREQAVDLMMLGIKRWCEHMSKKHVCSTCSMDMYLSGVFMFFKDLGGVTSEEALQIMMAAYNRAYAGEAMIFEAPDDVRH